MSEPSRRIALAGRYRDLSALLIDCGQGYIRQSLQAQLKQAHLDPQTPLRSNRQETRPKAGVRQLQPVHRLIERVNNQLSERSQFERIRARNLWHLTSRVNRKVLAHALCGWLNRQLSRSLLQFDDLVGDWMLIPKLHITWVSALLPYLVWGFA